MEEELVQPKPFVRQTTPLVQRLTGSEREEVEWSILTKGISRGTQRMNGDLSGCLNRGNGLGQPLPKVERSFMERRFGVNFRDVKVHTDINASIMARELNAKAFTHGRDIYFGAGRYDPGTASGDNLLAHELTHVVQQSMPGLAAPAVQRAETDTRGLCEGLADGCDTLNGFVNSQIRGAYADAFHPAGRSTLPRPFRPINVVERTYQRLGSLLPIRSHLPVVADWANRNLPNRSHGWGGYIATGAGTKYEHAQGGLLSYLAPAVNLNGNCIGTDKIDHMFHVGYRYFQIFMRLSSMYRSSRGPTAARRMGERYARAWGEWSEGSIGPQTQSDTALMSWLRREGTPQGVYGLSSTGVHSRADLAANEAGLRFYRDLLDNPTMTFDIRRYVSADWDEEIAGNIYRHDIGEAVRQAGRLNPADVVLTRP